MKNLKLTLVTTLSVLAFTFASAASADGGKRFKNHKQKNVISSSVYQQKNFKRNAYKTKTVKRVIVKNTPTKKVVITKTIINKPAKFRSVKNKRFQHVKRFNKQYRRYQARNRFENRHVKYGKRYNRFNTKRQTVYSVRPGDTLIQISYKTGVSIKKLARLNRFKRGNLNYLRIGQKIRLV